MIIDPRIANIIEQNNFIHTWSGMFDIFLLSHNSYLYARNTLKPRSHKYKLRGHKNSLKKLKTILYTNIAIYLVQTKAHIQAI